MNDYTIMTDTGCDIAPELLADWQVQYVDLYFHYTHSPEIYRSTDVSAKKFYENMRKGRIAKTSAANLEGFRAVFEPELREGRDILYLSFSASLSNSCHVAEICAKELMEAYPGRTILVVDSCCASAGLGLLVYLTCRERDAGASLAAAERFARDTARKICHWFTVDELQYLRRGGRISGASALAGTVLRIKPVMHMDDEGRLTNVHKVRGRKQAIDALAEQYFRTALEPAGIYFISHSDCMEDAEQLEAQIFEKTQRRAEQICDIAPIIGAHAGPGTLALFYLGERRS